MRTPFTATCATPPRCLCRLCGCPMRVCVHGGYVVCARRAKGGRRRRRGGGGNVLGDTLFQREHVRPLSWVAVCVVFVWAVPVTDIRNMTAEMASIITNTEGGWAWPCTPFIVNWCARGRLTPVARLLQRLPYSFMLLIVFSPQCLCVCARACVCARVCVCSRCGCSDRHRSGPADAGWGPH